MNSENNNNQLTLDIKEVIICKDCNKELIINSDTIHTFEFGGEEINTCHSCFDTYIRCVCCDSWIKKDDSLNSIDGSICQHCYDNSYKTCKKCDDIIPTNRTREVKTNSRESEYWCKSCRDEYAVKCGACGDWIISELSYTADCTNNQYCESCFNDNFSCCNDCNEYFRNEDIDENGLCENCREEDTSIIHDHNFTPRDLIIYGHNKKTDYQNTYGIELEMEAKGIRMPSFMSEYVSDNNLPFYCKRDGSLNNGVEVVSYPMTYRYIMDNKPMFSKLLDTARKNGFKSYNTDTCGIHIHVSRKEIGTMHFFKILKFVYENPTFIVLIAQRSLEKINRWAMLTGDSEKLTFKAKCKDKTMRNKYCAINMTHKNTFEFRIFKGTLNEKSFFKNIEFIKALIDFSRSISIEAVTVKNFLVFVKDNRKEFSNLFEYLTAKNKYNVLHHDTEFKTEA